MKEYILSIVSVILLTAAVGVILPEGKTGQFVKGIFAVATLVVILTPLANLGAGEPAFDFPESAETAYDEGYLDYIYDKRCASYETALEAYIGEQGCEGEAEVCYGLDDREFFVTKVIINLKISGISDEDEHIYIMSQIQKTAAEYCNVEEDKVQIHEIFTETERK